MGLKHPENIRTTATLCEVLLKYKLKKDLICSFKVQFFHTRHKHKHLKIGIQKNNIYEIYDAQICYDAYI